MKPKNIDEYIAAAPEEVREKLEKVRAVIMEVAPDAQEGVGFGMPYYYYKGRLVYFKSVKGRIEVYFPQLDFNNKENDEADRVTIRFSPDEKPPFPLLKKLLKARIKLLDIIST